MLACHECDLLQHAVAAPPGGAVRCSRCNALLYRDYPGGFDRTLACLLGAAILFIVSNGYPIVGLNLQGNHTQTTLIGTVNALYAQDMLMVAVLVLLTTLILPAIEIAAMLYMLLPVRLGYIPLELAAAFRLVQTVRPWGMVEVFIIGVLVALVKLGSLAEVVPGIAMASFATMIVLLAAGAASFEAHELWARVEAISRQPRANDKGRETLIP